MKRLLGFLVALSLLLTIVIAPAAAEDQTVISLFYGVDATGAMAQIIASFEAAYPQYKVNWVEAPASQDTSHDMLVTSLAAGESVYDVFASNVIWPAEFSQAGYSLPLDRYIERDGLDMNEYSQGYVNAYTFQGKMWGMPYYGNVGILYYRTDIIDTPPTTWDELIAMAQAHAGEGGTKAGYVMQAAQYEGLVCNALEFIGSYGGTIVDGNGDITINNDGVRNGVAEMKKIVDSGIVPANITAFKENECTNMFLAGEAIFMRNWPGIYASAINPEKSQVTDKFGVTVLPAGDAGSASTLGGWGFMVNRNSANPDAAWDFIKYLTGPEGQKINAMVAGQLPTYMSLYDDPEILAKYPHFAYMRQALEVAFTRPVSPIYTSLSEIMQINLSSVLLGQADVETAVAAMDEQMKAKVAAYGK